MQLPTYRPGAAGALMDEYERAIHDFSKVVLPLPQRAYEHVRDDQTTDGDTRSILTVTRHVLRSGYGYASRIREALTLPPEDRQGAAGTPQGAVESLAEMAAYTEAIFEGRWHLPEAVLDRTAIQTPWGPSYTLEQMFEHAIVHVLRHRRQVERFLGMAPRR
jgi:uncharacterized damage-inducible protein DinB